MSNGAWDMKSGLRTPMINTRKSFIKVFLAIAASTALVSFIYVRSIYKPEPCSLKRNAPDGTKAKHVNNADTVSFFQTDNPFKDKPEWHSFQKALADYKVFHKSKLMEMKNSKGGGDVKTLTWACSQSKCSGLGDQLFRIQYFLLLAMMSDRLFTVYWDEKMQKSTQYLLPNEIDWSYFDRHKGMCDDSGMCSHKIYDRTSLWGFGWTRDEFVHFGKVLFSTTQHITVTGEVMAYNMYIGNLSMMDPGPLILEGMKSLGVQTILGDKDDETVYCGHKPLWYTWLHRFGMHYLLDIPEINNGQVQANEAWLYLSHYTFTYLFKFSKDLIQRVDSYKKQLNLYQKDYLALHLRTGFMGTPDQEKFVTRYIHSGWKFFYHEWEWDCFIKHAINLRDETLGPGKPIYLSTDSDPVRRKIDTVYKDQNFIYGKLKLVHSRFDHKGCGVEVEDHQRDDAVEGHLAMWLDFFLLGGAKFIVHPDSSFSVNAAFVQPIPHHFHSWVLWDHSLNCLATYRAGKVSCVKC